MAAAKVLATTVHVTDETGQVHILDAGAEVPAELAKLITNPKAWASDEKSQAPASGGDESDAGKGKGKKDKKSAKEDSGTGNGDASDSGSGSSGGLTKPPRVGAGSGTDPWRDYAKGLGITVPDDANREAIWELVEAHEAATV